MLRRIKRDFRKQNSPARFLALCNKIKHCLTGNQNYPDHFWAANTTLLQQFFELLDRLEQAYHLASNGDRVRIRERDKLMEEMIPTLDELASLLEAASTRNPDALFTTGFSITQERRSTRRTKIPLLAPTDFSVVNHGDRGKALCTASSMVGAFNHEIHMNRNNPSVEEDWFHKAIFPNPDEMIIENVDPGHVFFRIRHHGPDGPGPWSSIVSATIT